MKPTTVCELIYCSYANLAMWHSAVAKGQSHYTRHNFMIRARLYRGLMSGEMVIGSILDDEKIKIVSGAQCAYCGAADSLSIDHLMPRALGGEDVAENMVCACRSCNSAKGRRDLVEWYSSRGQFPPLFLLRRYLKLVFYFCKMHQLLDSDYLVIDDSLFPFKFRYIPLVYPQPTSCGDVEICD